MTSQPAGRRLLPRWVRRVIVAVLLAPFGTICLAFPFYYLFVGPLGNQLLADTKGMLGGGQPVQVRIHQVVCAARHYGSTSRGHTDYECMIFPIDGPIFRIERLCATNRSGQIPTLRRISEEPVQYAVSWGPWELLSRFLFVLGFPVFLVFGFGCACLYASYIGWTRP